MLFVDKCSSILGVLCISNEAFTPSYIICTIYNKRGFPGSII